MSLCEVDYLTPEELNFVLDEAENPRDFLLVKLLALIGLRVKEVLGMRPSWIDFHKRVIMIPTGEGEVRTLDLDRETCMLLKNYIESHKIGKDEPCFQTTSKKNKDGSLFFSRQRLFQIISKLGEKALNGRRVNPQTLRNTFAINYLRKKGDVKNLQSLLGLKKQDSLIRYVKFVEKMKNR